VQRDHTVNPLVPRLVVKEIETGNLRVIATEGEPRLVSWGLDSKSIYYSTQTFDHNLLDDLSEEQLAQFNAAYGFELGYVPAYSVSVYRVDLTTENMSVVVYQGDAYEVAHITETQDAVYISQIPNMQQWIEGIRLKEITLNNHQSNMDAVQTEVIKIERSQVVFDNQYHIGYFEQFTPLVQ
jgi:hypothetical protein